MVYVAYNEKYKVNLKNIWTSPHPTSLELRIYNGEKPAT